MKYLSLCLIVVMLVGCGFGKKPQVVDPCAKAPKTCWYSDTYKTPQENPACLELMKCYEWEMLAK